MNGVDGAVWIDFLTRLTWLTVGIILGTALGYMVKTRREMKEAILRINQFLADHHANGCDHATPNPPEKGAYHEQRTA